MLFGTLWTVLLTLHPRDRDFMEEALRNRHRLDLWLPLGHARNVLHVGRTNGRPRERNEPPCGGQAGGKAETSRTGEG
jgi:hypothetical protein